MVEQKSVEIGGVNLPIIVENGIEYYPISYLSEKVLLRKNEFVKKKDAMYTEYIKKFKIKFGEKNIQESNCISANGLIRRLKNTNKGTLSEDQRRFQNHLHIYLGLPLMNERAHIERHLDINRVKNEYDSYTYDLIQNFLINHSEIIFQLCSKCEKYFPLDNVFYMPDVRTSSGYFKICNRCNGKVQRFRSENEELYHTIKVIGSELYDAYINEEIHTIYKALLDSKISKLPDCYQNTEDYLKIIKYLYDNEMISIDEIDISILETKFKLDQTKKLFGKTVNAIIIYLFGEESIYYPFKYKKMSTPKIHTFEQARLIFNNYLKENNISIDDVLAFRYGETITNARIRLNRLMNFVVWYNGFEYAGYKFGTVTKNYYQTEDNVIFDLKYLIEKDLNIEVEKVPLYLTKNSLRINANPLYNYIVSKQNGSIYEWINKIYPDKFTPYDFDINYYRDNFDSIEESQIHEVLIDCLVNVMYNARNTKRSIKLESMQPDWIVIGKEKCWFIEYFGLHVENGGYNSRTNEYTQNTKNKINTYENELSHYGKIYLYPEDLKNNFSGVREKIKVVR